ncbi:MAG: HEPN domain-containing protein [Acetobacteraceae bacterium]
MKPEAAAFLAKAHECLAKADGMLGRWPDEAGREAYLAGLHAAQAFLVERTGEVVRRHRGVQRELARLTKDTPQLDPELRTFLGRSYNLKAIADYEIGPDAEVTRETAAEAIRTARRFVARMAELIEAG